MEKIISDDIFDENKIKETKKNSIFIKTKKLKGNEFIILKKLYYLSVHEEIFERNEYKLNLFSIESYVRKTNKIPIQLIEKYPDYFIYNFSQNISSSYFKLKKIIDILFSSILIVLLLPIFAFISLIVLLTSGFPIIFKQKRIGKGFKPFLMYKFRTYSNNHITKFGKFLRRTKLDELPQFFNVLKGDMSIVGPRPEIEKFHTMAIKNIPFYGWRLKILPGITGWAQVNYKYTQTLEEYKIKTEYDFWYILNTNFKNDLLIMYKTIFKKHRKNNTQE